MCKYNMFTRRMYTSSAAPTNDTTPPDITGCPGDIAVSAPQGSTAATVTWEEPTASDNSGDTPTVEKTHEPGSSFASGSTEVLYTFSDGSGNMATCGFQITVMISEYRSKLGVQESRQLVRSAGHHFGQSPHAAYDHHHGTTPSPVLITTLPWS